MPELQEMKCEPCQKGAQPLKGEEISKLRSQIKGWDVVEEHHLVKDFDFEDFEDTLEFVNKVGKIAEQQGHHPTITFTYGEATIEIFTHKIGGLSKSDFILAAKIDQID